MQAVDFKVGTTYISTVIRGINFAGRLYKEGDTLTFTVIEKPYSKVNGNWVKVRVESHLYAWEKIYLHNLEHISELK